MQYTVTAYVNVGKGSFLGLLPTDPIAEVGTFDVLDVSPLCAAETMFALGNRMTCDINGQIWPSDVRSMSVGDLIKVVAPDRTVTMLACAASGWDEIPEPGNPIVPIVGTRATSRKAD